MNSTCPGWMHEREQLSVTDVSGVEMKMPKQAGDNHTGWVTYQEQKSITALETGKPKVKAWQICVW